MMQTLVGHTSAELTELLTTKGLPGYRGKQLGKGLYTRFLRDFEGFTDLPKALREQLAHEFTLAPCTERSIQSAPDGTEKYLLNLPDDEVIEAVYLPYDERTSVCVSSQVGCPMACSFCATGTEGLARNLTDQRTGAARVRRACGGSAAGQARRPPGSGLLDDPRHAALSQRCDGA